MARDTQTLSVLFADVTGSTRLYQVLGDDKAFQVVSECLGIMQAVIPRFGGRLVKTIGDEVMCVFPGPDAAVAAAAEMQSEVTRRPMAGQQLSIHAGIHHGPCVVEGLDVFGDTVNVSAYLTAVAGPEEILTTEAVVEGLSSALRTWVRPVFRSVLKGAESETTVYEVLWSGSDQGKTEVNPALRRVVPADRGGLMLTMGDLQLRLNRNRPSVLLGRGEHCDIPVDDRYASLEHALLSIKHSHFYLEDRSINGTFVLPDGGDLIHVLRREILLDGGGRICLGRHPGEMPANEILYNRDRRSLYRV